MTSSLVGSEMCIRDSSLICSSIEWQCKMRATHAQGKCNMDGGKATCCPVSYTHLTLPTICSV
eukprot:10554363-Prorocentrum_lima.AAC.1